MGQEIVYCYNCQTRLLGSDFEKGHAFRVGAQVACPECVRGLFPDLSPEEADAEIERLKITQLSKKAVSTTRIPVAHSAPPDTTTRNKIVPHSGPPKSKLPLIVGGVVAVAIILLVFLFSGSPERRTSTVAVDPPTPAPAPAPAPAPTPVPAPGAELPAGAFVELDRQIASRIESDDFSAAARDLDRARSRRSEAGWRSGIEERRAMVEKKAMAALSGFIEPALAAHHEGRADEVERLRSFIAAFPSVAAEFDRRLGERATAPAPNPTPAPTPKPAPKPSSPKAAPSETAGYKSAWDKAMSARDPEKIAASLEGTLKGLKTAEAKTEATQDIALLKSAVSVRADGAALVARLPKDQKVKLEFSDDSMVVGSFEGTVQSIDSVRVRLATESGILDLPVSEVSDETLARLAAARSPADAKAAAMFCALRGLAEAAEKLDATLPRKYLEFAKKPVTAEADAERRAFWVGFTEATMTRSRAAGLDRLSKLNAPRYKPFTEFLMEGAKEAFFSGTDIAATGTFAAHEREKVGPIWMSNADVKTGWSTVEVEYYALPDQVYKAWVYAGGCCQEVFQFSMQTPGLKGIDAKSKEEVTYEIGDPVGMPVRVPSMSLKKIHSQHLGPKEPDRWEWIVLPLPKSETSGPKKIRLLTDQKGFSVAHVVVSATRKGPPSATELKELLRDRGTAPKFIVAAGPATGTPTKSPYYGGKGGADFEEMGPSGAVLVGFKWSAKGSGGRMKYLQAIYRLSDTVTRGGGHGQSDSGGELVAKPGYAVGQVILSSSDRLDGFKLVYMRQAGGRLLSGDSYESAWVGAPLKGESKTAGDGSPIGGFYGKAGGEIDGFGLILLK